MSSEAGGEVPPSVAHLRQSLTDLIAESQALRSDVHKAEAARRRITTISLALIAAMIVPLVILLVLVVQNNGISREVHDTNEVIADCTNPSGKCAQQSSRRTGEAIGDIIRAEIYMAQCSRLYPGEAGPEFDRKLEKCVYDRLAAFAAQRDRSPAGPTPTPGPSGR